MFQMIHGDLSVKKENYRLVDVLNYLDYNKETSQINAHLQAKYKVDQKLIDTLNEKTKIKL